MIVLRWRWTFGWLLVAMATAQPAHAGRVDVLRDLIEDGEYAKALERGEQWLEKDLDEHERDLLKRELARASWLQASQSDDVKAHADWLQRWPADDLRPIVDEQTAWRVYEAVTQDPPDASRQAQFRGRFPTSPLVADSLAREEEQAWLAARQTDRIDAYVSFLRRWPEGYFTTVARDRLADLVYRSVRERDELGGYLEFLSSYPDSPWSAEAATRCEGLAWERAIREDSVEAFRAYRTAFHSGDRYDEAVRRELALDWSATRAAHTIPRYRRFETDHPADDLALVAEQREWDLYHATRPLYPGEYRPGVTRSYRLPDGTWRLFVDVVDEQGAFVGGLRREHFSVYDAGYAADIVDFAGMEQNRPLDVVFVVDISGSMQEEIDGVKAGIQRFADIMTLRSRDLRLGMLTFVEEIFSTNGQVGWPGGDLTADALQFRSWVAGTSLAGGAEENHFMALEAASALKLRPEAQRLLIILSDEAPTHARRWSSAAALLPLLVARDTTVFAVTPDMSDFQQLALGTGGAWMELPSPDRFPDVMEALSQKISKQYRIVYRRPPEAPPVTDALKVVLRVQSDHVWLDGAASTGALLPGQQAEILSASLRVPGRTYLTLSGGGLLCSADGGGLWHACGAGLPPVRIVLLSEDAATGAVRVSTADGRVFQSVDGGVTFAGITPEGLRLVSVIATAAPGLPLLGTDGHALWRLAADGAWTSEPAPAGVSGITRVAVGAWGGDTTVLVFDDASALWVRHGADAFTAVVNVPWSAANAPTRVWFHPTRRGLGFAAGASGMWRTIDGGATWRAVPGILGIVRDMIFDPTVRNLTVVLTDRGIWSSSDLGRSWRDDESDPTGARAFPVSGTIGANGRMVLTTAAGGTIGLERVANREFVFSNVFFAPGSAVPDPGLEPHLDDLARRMLSDRSTVLRVDGHTDSDGSAVSNLDLSQRRARWVVDFIASRGVPLSRLQAVGYGESRPLFSNDAPGGKARNRRVELVLLGPSGSLPKLDGMQ